MEFSDYNEVVQSWIRDVEEHHGRDVELTLKCCNDLIQYGIKNNDNKILGFAHYYSGETYYLLNDGVRFFDQVSKALSRLDAAEEWELMAKCYNFLGIWAINRGNAPIAQDYYLNGINYCKKYHLHKQEAVLQINIGALYMSCERYQEALAYLEQAFSYMSTLPKNEDYHVYMLGIYQNMMKCLIPERNFDQVEEILRKIYKEHWEQVDDTDRLTTLCTEALYYHALGNFAKRDECINRIQLGITDNMAILDMFDDYYDYAVMLLNADQKEAFWKIMEILEPLVRSCNILNLQLRIISLKIQYYRAHGQNADYLQAAGFYYELSERMEIETKTIMNNVLNLRRSLETANRARQEVEMQNQILVEKSEMDPLTKLANRFRLNDYSEEIFARVSEAGEPLAVEILDIDYFKEYNDNYGHQEGDSCLVAVANAIKETASAHGGFCARYGGDEFVIIYTDLSREDAVNYAAELRKRVIGKAVEHRFSKAYNFVTVSQGLCWGIPQKGNRMWDFLHAADDMLYKVKGITRNNYCVGDVKESPNYTIGPILKKS